MTFKYFGACVQRPTIFHAAWCIAPEAARDIRLALCTRRELLTEFMRNFPLSLARASSDTRTSVFLSFLLLAHIVQLFISNSFKFVAFELTRSASIVSLVGSVSAIAFITFGVFSGIIVDAFSRSFFAVFHLMAFTVLSLIFYAVYENVLSSIYLLFVFILLHETLSSFSKGSNNTIFFDLCATERLSRCISCRSIVFTVCR